MTGQVTLDPPHATSSGISRGADELSPAARVAPAGARILRSELAKALRTSAPAAGQASDSMSSHGTDGWRIDAWEAHWAGDEAGERSVAAPPLENTQPEALIASELGFTAGELDVLRHLGALDEPSS